MNVTYVFEKLLAAFVNPRIRGIASKGGTRSSKTWSTLQLLHLVCVNSEKPLVISCVAATLPMVKRGMMRDNQRLFRVYADEMQQLMGMLMPKTCT